MPSSFETFLETVRGKLGEECYDNVCRRYQTYLENCAPPPLRVPDSMRANAMVWGYSDMLNILTPSGAVDGNDCTGKAYTNHNQPAPSMKDQSGQIDPKNWEHPKFKKPTHLTSIPIRKMMERAQSHIKKPMELANASQVYPNKVGPFSGRDGYNVPVSTYVGGDSGGAASASASTSE